MMSNGMSRKSRELYPEYKDRKPRSFDISMIAFIGFE